MEDFLSGGAGFSLFGGGGISNSMSIELSRCGTNELTYNIYTQTYNFWLHEFTCRYHENQSYLSIIFYTYILHLYFTGANIYFNFNLLWNVQPYYQTHLILPV